MMKVTPHTRLAHVAIICMLLLPAVATAQIRGEWSPVNQLSTGQGRAIEASSVTDNYGLVHTFWAESPGSGATLIQYSQFDGNNWTPPNDLFLIPGDESVGIVKAVIDQQNKIHLFWTQGAGGIVFFANAPSHEARSARNWSAARRVDAQADELAPQVDSQGVLHLLYVNRGSQSGVFYIWSDNEGFDWSNRIWIDPDILIGFVPISLHAGIDNADGLHAVWAYKSEESSDGDWVRYTRLDRQSDRWSTPFTIAKNDEGADELNAFSRPILTVQGQSIHIIWASGKLLFRHHRLSQDGGVTWSDTSRVFGRLNGQAGDGFAIDSNGRIHYFGQIRFPQGIYHAMWDENKWSEPEMIYLLRNNAGEDFGDNVEAHRTFPAIRNGNQLILTFTDGPADPNRQLFITTKLLTDAPTIDLVPLPTPQDESANTDSLQATPVPDPTPAQNLPLFNPDQGDHGSGSFTLPIWISLIPTALLIAGITLYQAKIRRT